MDVSNNWTIVVGVATIISMIFLWSNTVYMENVRRKEEHIIRKVKADLSKKLKNSGARIRKIGEEQFVDEIYDIVAFKRLLRRIKDTFERNMIPSGIFICIFAVILVCVWQNTSLAWRAILIFVILLLFFMVLLFFHQIRKDSNLLERYTEGEDPTEILKDDNSLEFS